MYDPVAHYVGATGDIADRDELGSFREGQMPGGGSIELGQRHPGGFQSLYSMGNSVQTDGPTLWSVRNSSRLCENLSALRRRAR